MGKMQWDGDRRMDGHEWAKQASISQQQRWPASRNEARESRKTGNTEM